MKALKTVVLDPNKHRRTGATKYYVNNQECVSLPARLDIVSFEGDTGCNLIHFDTQGNEITDTWHESVLEAMSQANADFLVDEAEWGTSY